MSRKLPEGLADMDDYYVVSGHMADTASTPTNVEPAASNALLAMEILHYEKENRKMMSGWKTIAFNMALAVVGVLQTANWVDVIPGQYTGPLVAVIGMVGIWLRSVTKTPAGVAQEKK
jgi:hypothetical protein